MLGLEGLGVWVLAPAFFTRPNLAGAFLGLPTSFLLGLPKVAPWGPPCTPRTGRSQGIAWQRLIGQAPAGASLG